MAKRVLSDLAVVLVFLRLGQGWSQAQLTAASRISQSRLNDYENGRATLKRERLEQLARVMGLPPERIDDCLACLAANRAASDPSGGAGGELGDERFAQRRQIEAIVNRISRLEGDHARSTLLMLTSEGEALVDRQRASRQFARLRKGTLAEARFLVERSPGLRNWALVEKLALESIRLAPNQPHEARDWAHLAVRLSELVPGEEPWRRRLQGWALHFLANAERVCGDLPAGDRALVRGRKLWEAGAAGDRGLLDAAWLPWIEANLRKDHGRLQDAIQLFDEALALDGGELRGEILLNKSGTFARMGDTERSTAMLLEAEPLIDARRKPRVALALRFNLLVDLSQIGQAAEAAERLPEVREIAKRLGETLDLTRCLWLEGLIESGLGRPAQAIGALRQVRRDFFDRGLAFAYALVSMDLSLVLLEQGRSKEVREVAEEMVWLFQLQDVPEQALAALLVFCKAAKQETATVALARRVERFLRRAEIDPELRFEENGPRG